MESSVKMVERDIGGLISGGLLACFKGEICCSIGS